MKNEFDKIIRYFQNIYWSMKINRVSKSFDNALVYRGLKRNEVKTLIGLYKKLSPIKHLKFSRIIFSTIFNDKMVVVVQEKSTAKLIGIAMYHFIGFGKNNSQVHQFFTGIDTDYQGKGIGTKLRRKAMQHFFLNKVRYISSNVSIYNKPSLISNQNLGFVPSARFYDNITKEETYILLCDLNSQINSLGSLL